MIVSKIGETTEDLFKQAIEYAVNNEIKTIIIFAKGIDNILKLKDFIGEKDINLIATTFPMNQVLYMEDENGEVEEVYPEIYEKKSMKKLKEKNVTLVSSTMPLDPIIIPGQHDSPYTVITKTLNLFGEGIDLIVQSALMTTDVGETLPGERVLSMNLSGFADINTTNSRFLFHPSKGLKINQIIK